MSKNDNLDDLVERITLKVKRELGLTEALPFKIIRDKNLIEKAAHPGQKITGFSFPEPKEPASEFSSDDLASYIDHTNLKPDATKQELKKLCDEAKNYGFKTVCVNSSNISYVTDQLKGSNVMPIAVVGFPLGAMATEAKVFETREATRKGAQEIDMVINIGELKSKEHRAVYEDIKRVVQAAQPYPVKVIIETGLLDTEEKIIASALAKVAGAQFVKTSTGFSGGGATVDDVKLLRMVVGDDMKIKASGGIKNYSDALSMIKVGANRIGASRSVAIMEEAKKAL